MPIITKPASILKNTSAEITLDKATLEAVASVAADTYFNDPANWKEIFIHFKSTEGNQKEILKFDATLETPTANFLVSDKARDNFEVLQIVIKDFDNGSFVVPRAELVTAEFDIELSEGASFILTSEDGGILNTAVSFGSTVTNTTNSGSDYFGSFGFYYPSSAAGIDGVATLRHRIYLNSLNSTVGNSFDLQLAGYAAAVSLDGASALSQFASNGYVEIDYVSNSGFNLVFRSKNTVSGSISFSVSKIEVYAI